ncbi:MAG: putative dsRNA-binding protein, partial [Anaerococcus sp.]|nr:putative dsRNA-binding protein [Anaerococcus sp.]
YFNKTNKTILKYKLLKEEGPEHNKTFYMEVFAKNKKLSTGNGKNKKEAEQMAARIAYNNLTNE